MHVSPMIASGLLILTATGAAAQSYVEQRTICADKTGSYTAEKQIAACSAIIEARQEPDTTLSWFYAQRAELKAGSGDVDGAFADYADAFRLDPTSYKVLVGRGTLYAKRGKTDAALSDLNEAVQRYPDKWGAHFNRALAEASSNLAAAVDDFTAVLQTKPDYALAYLGRASAENQLGHSDEAKADYAKALQIDPDVVKHWKEKSGATSGQ
jgi:tetratricopeptide (TPR) repeat protein